MGRIDGVSSAGAVGPMQFLPSTWLPARPSWAPPATSCCAAHPATGRRRCRATTTPTLTWAAEVSARSDGPGALGGQYPTPSTGTHST